MGVKLVDNTEKVKAALKVQIAGGLNAAGAFWVDEARRNANVDTGAMRDSTGVTVSATPSSLFVIIRALMPYSYWQDVSVKSGNLWWTRAFLATRQRFHQFIYQGRAHAGGAGAGVVKAALSEYHGVSGRKGGGF